MNALCTDECTVVAWAGKIYMEDRSGFMPFNIPHAPLLSTQSIMNWRKIRRPLDVVPVNTVGGIERNIIIVPCVH